MSDDNKLYVSLEPDPLAWVSSTLPEYSPKRLTVRVEIPPTLLQDALRTFYGLVCRYEDHLAVKAQAGNYVPWRDAMLMALSHNGVDIDEQDATQAVHEEQAI